MTPLYTALTLIGGLLLLLSVTSGLIKSDLYLSEPLVALLLGVLVGPGGEGEGLEHFGPPEYRRLSPVF